MEDANTLSYGIGSVFLAPSKPLSYNIAFHNEDGCYLKIFRNEKGEVDIELSEGMLYSDAAKEMFEALKTYVARI